MDEAQISAEMNVTERSSRSRVELFHFRRESRRIDELCGAWWKYCSVTIK